MRARRQLSRRDMPEGRDPETSKPDLPRGKGLLTLRAAVILGSSLVLAIAAGILTYVSSARHAGGMPTTAMAAGAAVFVAAVQLLDAIIAD
jgi:hypothetical protein